MNKRIGQKIGLAMLVFGLSGATVQGTVLYVQKDAQGLGNGQSWANAYNELYDALAAAQPPVEIWVAVAVGPEPYYTPSATADPGDTFDLDNWVKIYGGFLGTYHAEGGETQLGQRDWVNNVTILSGDLGGQTSDVIVTGDGVTDTAVLNGFTITGADQHAIVNKYSSARYENLLITDNESSTNGAGMFNNNNSAPTVFNCTFSLNVAQGNRNGGGMADAGGHCCPKNRDERDGGDANKRDPPYPLTWSPVGDRPIEVIQTTGAIRAPSPAPRKRSEPHRQPLRAGLPKTHQARKGLARAITGLLTLPADA
jgi:hypothetical protein